MAVVAASAEVPVAEVSAEDAVAVAAVVVASAVAAAAEVSAVAASVEVVLTDVPAAIVHEWAWDRYSWVAVVLAEGVIHPAAVVVVAS